MANLLEMHGVCRRVSESFSLADVGLAVAGGEVVGFVGANGAGKTTTIRAALGLVHVDSGSIELFDMPFGADADDAAQRDVRSRVGVVLDSCPFPRDHTVAQVAACVACVYPLWDQARFDALVAQAGITPKTRVRDLSRGMGMKLTLACALAHSPKLLVLDEATAGLDPIARDEVIEILRDFMLQDEERGILISSHITSDLDKLADIIVCIDAGHIVFSVSRDEIEQAGIALCRESELSALANNSQAAGVRIIREAYAVRALVPNRFGFAQQFPHIALEPANTESYMQLMMKGEQL